MVLLGSIRFFDSSPLLTRSDSNLPWHSVIDPAGFSDLVASVAQLDSRPTGDQ